MIDNILQHLNDLLECSNILKLLAIWCFESRIDGIWSSAIPSFKPCLGSLKFLSCQCFFGSKVKSLMDILFCSCCFDLRNFRARLHGFGLQNHGRCEVATSLRCATPVSLVAEGPMVSWSPFSRGYRCATQYPKKDETFEKTVIEKCQTSSQVRTL